MKVGSAAFAFIGGSKANITPRDTLGEFYSVPRSFLFQGVPEGEKGGRSHGTRTCICRTNH